MLQRLPFIAVALLLCAFAYLLATGIAVPQAATGRAMFIVSAVSLFVSVVATVFALVAMARTTLMQARLERLTKSVDKAFSAFLEERDRDAVELDEREARLIEQLGQIDRSLAGLPETAPAPTGSGEPPPATNVVLHPAAKRPAAMRRPAQAEPAFTGVGHALAATVASIVLRPIVSTADGTIAGFEAARTDNAAIVLPPSPSRPDGMDLVTAAMDAISNELTAGRQPLPVHAAIDGSLVDDKDRLSGLLALLLSKPRAARFLVLSLPLAAMAAPGTLATGLARLAVAGVRFASEGWPGSEAEIEALWRSGVTFLRLPAARLAAADTRGQQAGAALAAMLKARGIRGIAVDTDADEDTAAFSELGIDLMVAAQIPANGAGQANGHNAPLRPV